ncbi:stalk domain-containing protein [Paenibacillus sp. MSJ-34]|uniref:stalk domain-containing protein n=1 Tax=Paenibacillus sp. MSJ-34 TaxID=2841529 RepID=UPI001C11A37A|nr:stalk domain-containing protein [Paenibacillus sp. MSJ-34]MBU5442241.1 copper amine oxidase N-terminal domain-containing protein [Paenibacillus sp. MSJ-34]
MKKTGLWFAVMLFAFGLCVPTAFAAEEEGGSIEFRVKVGSSAASINGQAVDIAKPYADNGTAMVPLSVITKAFGAKFTLEKNKLIHLTYGNHKIVFTIGEKAAVVDGKQVALAAAPKWKSDVLMVPLRTVVDAFGATLAPTDDGGIAVKASAPRTGTEEAGAPPSIDSDLGKTKIGNSYYNWSMKYPAGLVQDYYSPEENYISFTDAKGEYLLYIFVVTNDEEWTNEELLGYLTDRLADEDGVLIDKRKADKTAYPYAQVIAKEPDGHFSVTRAYYHEGTYYEVYFGDAKAKNYKELAKHYDLLDSFQPSFDAADKSMKDVSTVLNGFRPVENKDYGIKLSVPAEWQIDTEYMEFGIGLTRFRIVVSSADKGLTAEQWAQRTEREFRDSFAPDYGKVIDSGSVKAAGNDAVLRTFEYDLGDGWITEHEVFLVKGDYKYYLEYSFAKDESAKEASQFATLLKTVAIDFDYIDDNFGVISDPDEYVDRGKTAVKSSKAYNYSVAVPAYWSGDDRAGSLESPTVDYTFLGGQVRIQVDEKETLARSMATLKNFYEKELKDDPDVKKAEFGQTTVAGVPAHTFMMQGVSAGYNIYLEQVMFEKNKKTYILSLVINEPNRTDSNMKAWSGFVKSFQFKG